MTHIFHNKKLDLLINFNYKLLMAIKLADFLKKPLPEAVYSPTHSYGAELINGRLQVATHGHKITAYEYSEEKPIECSFGNIRKVEFTLSIPNPKLPVPQEVRANTFLSIDFPSKPYLVVVYDSTTLDVKDRVTPIRAERTVEVHYKDQTGTGPYKKYSCHAYLSGMGETIWDVQKNCPPQIREALKYAAEVTQEAMDSIHDLRNQAFNELRDNHRTEVGHRARLSSTPQSAASPTP